MVLNLHFSGRTIEKEYIKTLINRVACTLEIGEQRMLLMHETSSMVGAIMAIRPAQTRQKFLKVLCLSAVVALISFGSIGEANASELTIGTKAPMSTLDPQADAINPNHSIHPHIYEYLVVRGPEQAISPGLAVSWTPGDEYWDFKLRPDVRWHDGTPFTSDDVVFSMNRIASLEPSGASYKLWAATIEGAESLDPLTVRIFTNGPSPTLLNDLSMLSIVCKKTTEGMETSDFDSGKAANGTGPYKLVEWRRGERLVLEPNDDYWGDKEPWERVTFTPISNNGSRTAAFLAGDVDMIEQVPAENYDRIRTVDGATIIEAAGVRHMFLLPDTERVDSPQVTKADGSPIESNPMRKIAVRKAMSLAIDRYALVEKINNGQGFPNGQMMTPGQIGYSENLEVPKANPEAARQMLADAGYPDGFGLTITTTADRYPNDKAIAQAIAQMLTRIGIVTKVNAVPVSVAFKNARLREYSLFMMGSGGYSAEPISRYRTYISTTNPEKRQGAYNMGRYSNENVDQLLWDALSEYDDDKRSDLVEKALDIAIGEDQAIIPLYNLLNSYALRKGLTYTARADETLQIMTLREE
jgi:peptide/nickel transport system substrate-binding protein